MGVGVKVQVAVGASVAQTVVLNVQPVRSPGYAAAASDDLKGDIEVDQHVGGGDALPHVGHVRVFLDNVTRIEAAFTEGVYQRGFARRTGADDGYDKGVAHRARQTIKRSGVPARTRPPMRPPDRPG